jgi:N-acyl-D-glutamate deacylase
MALMPAQRLERAFPEATRLGRLQVGSQADIVVFDPATIQDRATFSSPGETSIGVQYLLVAGTIVVDKGRVLDGVAPGRPVLRHLNPRR